MSAIRDFVDWSVVHRAMPALQYVIEPALRIHFEGNDVRVNDGLNYESEYRGFGGNWDYYSAISVDLSIGRHEVMLFSIYYLYSHFMVEYLD